MKRMQRHRRWRAALTITPASLTIVAQEVAADIEPLVADLMAMPPAERRAYLETMRQGIAEGAIADEPGILSGVNWAEYWRRVFARVQALEGEATA